MLQVQIHGKPSFSKDGNRVQVTVVTGEGSRRRSTGKFGHRRGAQWFGLNTDKRAIPLNAKYEAELATAQRELASAKTALATLKKKLEIVGEVDPSKVDEVNVAAAKAMLEAMIETVMVEVITAEEAIEEAKTRLAIVRRDCPLEVQFIDNINDQL